MEYQLARDLAESCEFVGALPCELSEKEKTGKETVLSCELTEYRRGERCPNLFLLIKLPCVEPYGWMFQRRHLPPARCLARPETSLV